MSALVTLKQALAKAFGQKAAPGRMQAVGNGAWTTLFSSAGGYPGNFQQDIAPDNNDKLLTYSAVYSSVSLKASDIGKLAIDLCVRSGNTWNKVTNSDPLAQPLLKPNHYQTRQQFFETWVISLMLHGNTYVLKERARGNTGAVTKLHVLDPRRVTTLVSSYDGSVYYSLHQDDLSGIRETVNVPASEIIHDRINCLFHPLVGVSPLYACGISATQGNRIQANSARFFENMSRPSGMLTAPEQINDETAARLKREFETNFQGSKIGRLFVAGDNLKYEPMTIPAADAQLIEQLEWTVADVARAFKIPLHMLGAGEAPALGSVEALEQSYYRRALQSLIEGIEQCLDAGLELPAYMRTEFDLDGLMRMDSAALYEALGNGVKGGWMAPNEARARMNLPPVAGGESPLAQQQNYSLEALAKRDALPNPFAASAPAPAPSKGIVQPRVWREGAGWRVDTVESGEIRQHCFSTQKSADDCAANSIANQRAAGDGVLQGDLHNLVFLEVQKAVAAIPKPKDGEKGKDGADGKSVDPDVLEAMVIKYVSTIPKPKDGEPGKDGEHGKSVDAAEVEAMVQKHAATIPVPRDGRDGLRGEPGRDALQIEIVDTIDDRRQYQRGTFARHRGGLVRAVSQTIPLKDAGDFRAAGWQPVINGVAEEKEEAFNDGRLIRRTVTLTDGTTQTTERAAHAIVYRGVHDTTRVYLPGDCCTYVGSLWICKARTKSAPPGDNWQLAVKRGADGKDLRFEAIDV